MLLIKIEIIMTRKKKLDLVFKKEWLIKAGIDYDRESKVVAPTIYKMNYKTIRGNTYTLSNEEETNMICHIVSNTLPLRDGFSIIGNTLFDYILKNKYSKMELMLIHYIINKLNVNSNIITIDYEDAAKVFNTTKNVIKQSFTDLLSHDNNFIAKTNVPKTFIYDHNVIFKGKLSDFVNRYKALYGDNKAKINDKGRVIIK